MMCSKIYAQQNVFQLFRETEQNGDKYYAQGSYHHALEIFLFESRRSSEVTPTLSLKIARCYYQLHEYEPSLEWFRRSNVNSSPHSSDDVRMYAETLAANGLYAEAIEQFMRYASAHPDDERIQAKIWRLKNSQYLFEDSLHYSVRRATFSSDFSDFAATPYQNGVVFLSNRKGINDFDHVDALTENRSFKLLYCPTVFTDSSEQFFSYGRIALFNKSLQGQFENGPIQFYADDMKAVLVLTSKRPNSKGKKNLHLFFAEKWPKGWKVTGSFAFNNPEYSITDPHITSDGRILYFSSDMKGGYGGKDLYRSEYKDGKWTKPMNLGEQINTSMDEITPFVHTGFFYFASNGHAGLGGIDIFKATFANGVIGEVMNPGYPVNTIADDFGITFSEKHEVGLFSSNRNSRHGDDVFEIEMDLQTYPVTISGVVRYKEFSLTDSSFLSNLSGAKLYLVDHTRESIVGETTSDANGAFKLEIPYFSQFKIKVVEKNGTESIVSLYLPRQKQSEFNHEIVVVKNALTPQDE